MAVLADSVPALLFFILLTISADICSETHHL